MQSRTTVWKPRFLGLVAIWQNCVLNPVLEGFLPLHLIKTLQKAGGGRRPFGNFFLSRGVPNYSKRSTGGQCPQVLASTARKVAKPTCPCSYTVPPMRSRVQSRSRTQLRIAASIAFLFRACFDGSLDTIAPLSRGSAP